MIKYLMKTVQIIAVPAQRGLLLTLLIILSACGGDPDNPEQQIREMIGAGEEAFEARSIVNALGFIADGYQDQEGRQKKDMQRLVGGYILRNKSIHLLTRVQHVALNEDGKRADVVLYVGMAGVPVASVDQLVFTRADLYRFDLSIVLEEGAWRVANGSWHQARLEDF
jgi:hypothetical protein